MDIVVRFEILLWFSIIFLVVGVGYGAYRLGYSNGLLKGIMVIERIMFEEKLQERWERELWHGTGEHSGFDGLDKFMEEE